MSTQEQQRVEVSLVLQLLRNDHAEPWTCPELEAALNHIETLALRHALGELAAAGVAGVDGEQVQASASARHLDALGLIAV